MNVADSKDETKIISQDFIAPPFEASELIFALVGAVGANLNPLIDHLKKRLEFNGYDAISLIQVTDQVLKPFRPPTNINTSKQSKSFIKTMTSMDVGNKLREMTDDGIVGMAIADIINRTRKVGEFKNAYIVKSLKHPREVEILRTIYGNGFYLIGVHENESDREQNLCDKKMTAKEAQELILRDADEANKHGQKARDTFQLSDFFIDNSDADRVKASVFRFIDLIFAQPFYTPTFGEYAMYMAYSASLRSADLSRQIGAALCKNDEIFTLGANDCAKFGGGLYWSYYDKEGKAYKDVAKGRDYTRGQDSNKTEFLEIAQDIMRKLEIPCEESKIELLRNSKLGELTEYGRVVHAEMEAISACSRNSISCENAELYVTTFPCHNCAKHIITSGIQKVVYIEAYPKSRAFKFYDDSITSDEKDNSGKVKFLPFFGVGPKRYLDLFAMEANPLKKRIRKKKDGRILEWEMQTPKTVRSQMLPTSYLDRELEYAKYYLRFYELVNIQGDK